MSTVLHLDCSARRAGSLSRRMSASFVEAWVAQHPDDTVVYRDLALEQLPLVSDAWVDAAFSPAESLNASHRFALNRSDALIDELVAADLVVIGTPVYNFTVPAGLKAWIDQVARVGRTFAYGPDGMPTGLLGGRRLVIAASSGSGPDLLAAMGMDHHSAYLRGFFGFLGITDVRIVSAWGHDAATVERTLEQAQGRLTEIATGVPAPRQADVPVDVTVVDVAAGA